MSKKSFLRLLILYMYIILSFSRIIEQKGMIFDILPSFWEGREKRKGEKNTQNRDFKTYLSARSSRMSQGFFLFEPTNNNLGEGKRPTI